jgi:hypothetical protein
MKLKETEKNELEKMTLNKSDMGATGILEDEINKSSIRGKNNWCT